DAQGQDATWCARYAAGGPATGQTAGRTKQATGANVQEYCRASGATAGTPGRPDQADGATDKGPGEVGAGARPATGPGATGDQRRPPGATADAAGREPVQTGQPDGCVAGPAAGGEEPGSSGATGVEVGAGLVATAARAATRPKVATAATGAEGGRK